MVLPEGLFEDKSRGAKNFRQVKKVSLNKIKVAAKEMCQNLELNSLAKKVQQAKKLSLSVFFTAKTHKVECPLGPS